MSSRAPLRARQDAPAVLRLALLTLTLWLLCAPAAQAVCTRNNAAQYPFAPLSDGGSAQFWFGRINLASTAIQPVGTMLGSAVASAAEASGINGDTLLWSCDLADAGEIYEVFSTNGDDRVGGFAEDQAPAGVAVGHKRHLAQRRKERKERTQRVIPAVGLQGG